MASDVDICNAALGHIGNDNQISSISPPDGSTEAGYCKRFFAFARKELLESFNWAFATTRQQLTPVDNISNQWSFAYAKPSNCLKPIRVLRATMLPIFLLEYSRVTGDFLSQANESDSAPYYLEGDVIYTHEPQAVLVYLRDVTDSTKFTPTFTSTLGYLLASYLAGPILRGSEGASTAQKYRDLAMSVGGAAAAHSANASREEHNPVAAHLQARQ